MKYLMLVCVAINVFIASCKNEPAVKADKNDLIRVDKEFSDYSLSHGINAAFFKFADSGVVLLRPFSMPIEGIDSLRTLFSQKPDSNLRMSWEPRFAEISSSGDLGYTYGIYHAVIKADTSTLSEKGNYLTIWKKQPDGSWKFVVDTGNEGLEKKPE